MKFLLPIILIFIYSFSVSQSFSENDIKQLAQQINKEMQGLDLGNGISVRACFSIKRTIVYQYNVIEDWYPTDNMKDELIENFIKAGSSNLFANNDIDVEFYYLTGNILREKVSITAEEFLNINFHLGDYLSINGHPKSKDVNMKLKQPIGWKVEEGERPNIVKKFIQGTNSYMIIIKDNFTFFSRNEIRELLNDDEFINAFLKEYVSFMKNAEILNQEIVTIDTYPTLVLTIRGNIERSGLNLKMIFKSWTIFYEDKMVLLQCSSIDNNEYHKYELLYDAITNSIIFPEQYY